MAVVGAGWAGWGAAKALLEAGCKVTLLDALPDPTGATPYLSASGKPVEAGTRGFWKDYPNIEAVLHALYNPIRGKPISGTPPKIAHPTPPVYYAPSVGAGTRAA